MKLSKEERRRRQEEQRAAEEQEKVALSQLKCWKRWMLHEEPSRFNGWLIQRQGEHLAAGW
jgi:hypothetical protein